MKQTLIIILLIFYFLTVGFSQHIEWVHTIGCQSTKYAFVKSMDIDEDGNVYIVGSFTGTICYVYNRKHFEFSSEGSYDIFIEKFDANGFLLWAKRIGGLNDDFGNSIVVDNTGAVYITGQYTNMVDFDPSEKTYNLTTNGSDIFILKLDSDGNFIWAKRGGASSGLGESIAADAYNNVYITGVFSGTADFNPNEGVFNLTSVGNEDGFILKLDTAGAFMWAKQIGGKYSDHAYDIAIDCYGNVFTTGYFNDIVDFDPGNGVYNLHSSGMYDIFIQKIDSAGKFLWAKKMGGVGKDLAWSITTDKVGNIYTTGFFIDTVDFDPDSGVALFSTDYYDLFIQKLSSDGNYVWNKQIGAQGLDRGFSIAAGPSNNIYTTGSFEYTVDFDANTGIQNNSAQIGQDVFILNLDSNGNFVWVKTFEGAINEHGTAIAVDKENNVYSTGYFDGSINFEPSKEGYYVGHTVQYGNSYIHKMSQLKQSKSTALISIYPNPSDGKFSIKFNSSDKETHYFDMQIFSVLGALVYQNKIELRNANAEYLNIGFLSSGLYFISFHNKHEVLNTKIIIE